MYRSGRASGFALTAQTAFLPIDVREVVLDRDSLEVTLFLALTAAYTCVLARFARYRAFVFVAAEHHDSAVLRSFLTQLNQRSRTCLYALTARGTLLVIYDRQSCLRIHAQCAELTSSYAVTAAQTSERTSCFAYVAGMHDTAVTRSVKLTRARTRFAVAVTPYYGYHRVSRCRFQTEDSGNLLHRRTTAYGT